MTQLLLFDYPTTATAAIASPLPAASPVPVTSPAPAAARSAARRTPAPRRETSSRREPVAEASRVAPLASGSLPLYDPAQGELHRIGDLAQLVLARYEIVHRRRAARLRRAQAAPGLASQSR